MALVATLTACGGQTVDDPAAVPAAQVPGAEVASGQFQLLDTAPEGYQDVAGTAVLARHADGTTVTIDLRGLKPNTQFISHVHQGSCADRGGAHYKFDPAGGDMPPNEIHLVFTSTAEGTGYMTANNDRTAGPQAQSVVVHAREFHDQKLACAPLS
jgi:Cu/Zn superoxide dismutase